MIISKLDFRVLSVAFGVFAFVVAGARAETDDDEVAKGLAILQTHCARCHALGMTGASTHPQAPPFRDIVKRYPVEDLEESLAEGIVSGHPDMPEFTFDTDQIGAIVAYLNNLKAQQNGK